MAVMSFAGCGQPTTVGPVKTVVSGNVTLDNKPLAQGQIVFVDAEGNEQRKYGDQVINGKYSFEVTPGKKKVEISARESNGGPGSDPGSNLRELIPEQYNTKTTLTADIIKGNPKGGDFQLTSGPAPAK
ncbi:MAG: hypothetical protein JWN70_3839 [Planctomycetaceae bacterium]|nr:hypothetical protein [Planctomycetaceae bacterium]